MGKISKVRFHYGWLRIVFFISLLLYLAESILFISAILGSRDTKKIYIQGNYAAPFNNDWYFYDNDKKYTVSLPLQIAPQGNEAVSPAEYRYKGRLPAGSTAYLQSKTTRLYHKLPETLPSGACIGFYTDQQNAVVSAGGRILYTYQVKSNPGWLYSYGRFFHIVPIAEDLKGTELCITFSAVFKSKTGKYSTMFIGKQSEILNSFRHEHHSHLIFAELLLFEGIILLFTYLIFPRKIVRNRMLLYFSHICLLSGVWEYADSFMLQLLTADPAILWGCEYLSFILLPVAIIKFLITLTDTKKNTTLLLLFTAGIGVIVIQIGLQVSGIKQITETMYLTNILLVSACIYAVYLLLENLRNHKKYSLLGNLGILILVIELSCHEVIFYTDYKIPALIFNILFCIFLIIQFLYFQHFAAAKLHEIQKASAYQKLAFIDFSTGVSSRTAWYTFVEKYIPDEKKQKQEFCLILFDMNNLKKINDCCGHLTGDTVIKAFADRLKQAFGHISTIYRIGGDEFVCLCTDTDREKLAQAFATFEYLVGHQQGSEHPFTAAYGYVFFTPEDKKSFYEAQYKADANMYSMKTEMKSGDKRQVVPTL